MIRQPRHFHLGEHFKYQRQLNCDWNIIMWQWTCKWMEQIYEKGYFLETKTMILKIIVMLNNKCTVFVMNRFHPHGGVIHSLHSHVISIRYDNHWMSDVTWPSDQKWTHARYMDNGIWLMKPFGRCLHSWGKSIYRFSFWTSQTNVNKFSNSILQLVWRLN